jgi:hypothetical protein
MRGRQTRPVLGLVAVVAASAFALVLVVAWRGGDETTAQPRHETSPTIEAQASFTPRLVLFGDTVRAHVDMMLDTERVDPDSVRVASNFSPFQVVGQPDRRIVSAGEQAYLRTTFVLRCVTAACAQTGQSARYEFAPGRIAFSDSARRPPGRDSIRVSWPRLRVYSRFTASDLEGTGRASTPWAADLITLPAPSYRFTPTVLATLLVAGAALAALGAFALAYAAWPRREAAPSVEPEPEAAPEQMLSPLEQALALLEEAVRANGAADQRRALELVAEELELAEWGDPDLARAARALAWSKDVPPVEKTSGLAARVRSALPEIDDAPEDSNDRENGGVRAG